MAAKIAAAFRTVDEGSRVEYERGIVQRLKRKDAFGDYVSPVVVEEVNLSGKQETRLHFGNPHLANPSLITIPSRISAAEAEEIAAGIIAFPEACDVLTFIAENYALRLPILIEGPTALGKTFLINKFTQLLYGKRAAPVDFYCQGQTDVSELMAKWVPRANTAEDRDRWEQFLISAQGERAISEIAHKVDGEMGVAEPAQRQRQIESALVDLARGAGLSQNTQWQLQYGAVPKAMLGEINTSGQFRLVEPGGPGVPLHIQEVGYARPQVVAALLKLRGELGQIAEEIQLWEDGGRTIRRGQDFWYAMSTNPPEEYDAREPIDQALARGVVFKRVAELSPKAYEMVARRVLGYRAGNVSVSGPGNVVLELHRHPALCAEVSEIIASFHQQCVDAARTGESGRQQRIPVTFDDIARVAKYLAVFQVRTENGASLDMAETIRRACERMYLGRLLPLKKESELAPGGAAEEDDDQTHSVPVQAQLRAALEQLLVGETGMKRFGDKLMSRKAILDQLVAQACVSRVVTETSVAPSSVDRAGMVQEQVRHDAQDALSRAHELMRQRGLQPPPFQRPSNPAQP